MFWRLDVNPEVRGAGRGAQLRIDPFQVGVVNRRALARHTVMIHGVNAVGGDIDFVDTVPVVLVDTFDGDAGHGEVVGELAVVDLQVNEVANP